MKIYGQEEVIGSKVQLQSTHPKHYRVETPKETDSAVEKSFGDLFSGALGKVNNLLLDSDTKTQQMLVQPESISVHTVMISAQKAELALGLAKAVSERVIRAYQEVSNLR